MASKKTPSVPTKADIREWTEAARNSLLDAEKYLRMIVEHKGWTILGYPSAKKYFEAEFSGRGVRLFDATKVELLIAMFEDGETDDTEIAVAMGLRTKVVRGVREQYEAGVSRPVIPRDRPARVHVVPEHERKNPGPPQVIHIPCPSTEARETLLDLGRSFKVDLQTTEGYRLVVRALRALEELEAGGAK
jgi:hypothetical protein